MIATGQILWDWTIGLPAASVRWGAAQGARRAWHCTCKCGTKSVVPEYSLETGKSKRCRKCSSKLASEQAAKALTTHGHAPFGSHGRKPSRTYSSWYAMKARCSNPKNKRYEDYAGRGIVVCERWKDFQNFLADMGERPEGMTLDRINVNGNYEPANCRWADAKTQANNKRKLRVIDKYTDEEIRLEFIQRGLKIEP